LIFIARTTWSGHSGDGTKPVPGTLQEGGASFQTTHWTVVLQARQTDSTESAQYALSAFCEAYWPPLYAFLRHRGYPSTDAQDLVQGGEFVATEHWCSSGFANTDLDLQLKKHGIHKLIVIGLIAHTCVEATVRFAAELGYEVTMLKDATADYSDEEMHAALDVNIPNYASAIVTIVEIVESLSSLNRTK